MKGFGLMMAACARLVCLALIEGFLLASEGEALMFILV